MRKTYKVVPLYCNGLDSAEFFQLLSETKDVISAAIKSSKQDTAIYANRLTLLGELLAKMEASLHLSKKSRVRNTLEEADRERDDAFMTLTDLVRAFSRVKDAETKAAYDKLAHLFSNYSNLSRQNYEKETEGINHLLNQLKESDYQTALTRLHLTTHVEALKTTQKAFEKRYKERLNEQTAQTPSQVRALRLQLQEQYDFLIDFTAIHAYAYPDRTLYTTLRSQLNSLRERYKKLQLLKKAKKHTEESKLTTVDTPQPTTAEQP